MIERTLEHSSLCKTAVCFNAPIFTTAMRSLYINTHIVATCCFLYFSSNIHSQLFLQCATTSTPLCNATILAQADQFVCCNNTNVSNTGDWLVMMRTHAF